MKYIILVLIIILALMMFFLSCQQKTKPDRKTIEIELKPDKELINKKYKPVARKDTIFLKR